MSDQAEMEKSIDSWKTKTLLIGAAIGALVGAGAAYLLVQKSERDQSRLSISAGEGVKLGLLVLGLLRQVTQLGEEK
jgi:hypothetical protein